MIQLPVKLTKSFSQNLYGFFRCITCIHWSHMFNYLFIFIHFDL